MELSGAAKVTRCNHYFHGACLRKWLYVQDSCPLCHGALYHTKEQDESRDNAEVNNAQADAQNDGNEGLIDNDYAMERPIDDGDENNSESDVDDNDSGDSEVDMVDDIDELAEDTETSQDTDEGANQNSSTSCSCSEDDDDDLLYDSREDYTRGIHSKGDAQSLDTVHSKPQHEAGTSNTDASSSGVGDISRIAISKAVHICKGPSQLKNTEQCDHSGSLPFAEDLEHVKNDSSQQLTLASLQSDNSQKKAEENHSDMDIR